MSVEWKLASTTRNGKTPALNTYNPARPPATRDAMPLAQLLVRLAYRQQASTRYARLKGFFHKLLTDPRSRRRMLFDSFMIVLVLASVMLLIYEVRRPLGGHVRGVRGDGVRG